MQATIRAENGLFYGIINDNGVIAISDDIDVVAKRLKKVDKNIEFTIYDADKRRRYKTVESYYNSLLPPIYRITSSNKKDSFLIIAMNRVKSNHHSDVQLFYDVDELLNYFAQLKSKNYYVHVAHFRDISRDDKKKMGGIDALDIPAEFKDISDLRAAIKEREKAGSHDAYIEQVKKSKARLSRQGQYFYDGEREWSNDDE